MFEIIIVILVALTYAKASKHKAQSSYHWAFLGIVYYIIGRALFSGLMFLIVKFLIKTADFDALSALAAFEIVFGVVAGLLLAYFLGELSGLKIRKVLKGGR